MLRHEENDRITRTGPGTPLGRLMRAYWQPAALVSELDPQRQVKPVRLLGEDLVLFKRADGGWALVGRFCAHRGVDLAYGRHEDGGLRCLYHGWRYGPDGRCLEQPAEPPHSTFASKVRIPSYPCVERNGIVFAYLGEGDPPPMPHYDCFQARRVHLRLQRVVGVQLAAGRRGRHRPQPRLVPAPVHRMSSVETPALAVGRKRNPCGAPGNRFAVGALPAHP